jgi:LDH2 family malate/lactate/ureidoglycolate dehydrogenase
LERFTAEAVRAQTEAILRAWGMDEEKVRVTADVMVETDLMGIDSHGISMLIMYEGMQRAGQLRLTAEPRVVRQTASTALVDGGAGLGHPVSVTAMKLAIEKALAHDVGVVSVFNSHHFGAAGCYAAMAPRRGLIGVVASTSRIVNVVPTRGAERVLGTNPLAFAFPAGRFPPVVLDISTSVVAANKVKVYALQGEDIPAGWVVDGTGAALTDAAAAYRLLFEGGEGGLAPIGGGGTELGGHKGYGLGIVAQALASTLGGGAFSPIRNRSRRGSDPDNIGHFFMALNPAAFRPLDEFRDDLDTVIDTLRATRPARADEPVLIPGDPERAAREERLAHGIPLPEALVSKLREIAAAAGAPFLLSPA